MLMRFQGDLDNDRQRMLLVDRLNETKFNSLPQLRVHVFPDAIAFLLTARFCEIIPLCFTIFPSHLAPVPVFEFFLK